MILRIDVNATSRRPLPDAVDAASITRLLLERGYDELDLAGLSSLRAKLRDGSSCEIMPLRTDDDATFLMESYNHLFESLAEPPPVYHRTYLWDGSFEITGLILQDRVRVRAGEFRSTFAPESEEGVSLSRDQYRELWANILAELLRAADGGSARAAPPADGTG